MIQGNEKLGLLLLLLFVNTVGTNATRSNPYAIRGWSTWNSFACHINETLILESIESLANSPLNKIGGYNFVLIDDCWTKCDELDPNSGHCLLPGARDKDGKIQIDKAKFPNGFLSITKKAHDLGLKIGIYTSVSAVTCGGFTGSYMHEQTDAQSFVSWGFDLVKHDTCGTDYSVHNLGLQNATIRMRDALYESGQGKIIYYLDSGNPTSPQKMFNPHNRGVQNQEALQKLALKSEELAWFWTSQLPDPEKGPHLVKSWFDRKDSYASILSNAHNQIRIAEFQTCERLNNADMLTIGMGGLDEEEEKTQFFLWSILAGPLIMGNDIRKMDKFTTDLVTNPEILNVQDDEDCVQGSLSSSSRGAIEVWSKPLHDNNIAVVMINKLNQNQNGTVYFGGDWIGQCDFFPAKYSAAHVRDLYTRKDMGYFNQSYSTVIKPHGAVMLLLTNLTLERSNT